MVLPVHSPLTHPGVIDVVLPAAMSAKDCVDDAIALVSSDKRVCGSCVVAQLFEKEFIMPVSLLKKLRTGKFGGIDIHSAATKSFRKQKSDYSWYLAEIYEDTPLPSREQLQDAIDLLGKMFPFVCEPCHKHAESREKMTDYLGKEDPQALSKVLDDKNKSALLRHTAKPGILLLALSPMGEILSVKPRGVPRRPNEVSMTVRKDGTLALGSTRNLSESQGRIAQGLVNDINKIKNADVGTRTGPALSLTIPFARGELESPEALRELVLSHVAAGQRLTIELKSPSDGTQEYLKALRYARQLGNVDYQQTCAVNIGSNFHRSRKFEEGAWWYGVAVKLRRTDWLANTSVLEHGTGRELGPPPWSEEAMDSKLRFNECTTCMSIAHCYDNCDPPNTEKAEAFRQLALANIQTEDESHQLLAYVKAEGSASAELEQQAKRDDFLYKRTEKMHEELCADLGKEVVERNLGQTRDIKAASAQVQVQLAAAERREDQRRLIWEDEQAALVFDDAPAGCRSLLSMLEQLSCDDAGGGGGGGGSGATKPDEELQRGAEAARRKAEKKKAKRNRQKKGARKHAGGKSPD